MTIAGGIASALAAWPYRVDSVRPLGGGWNSATWLAETSAGRYVAKLVDHLDADGLASSLALAECAAARGLACGGPVRTRRGELTIRLADGVLALLRYEPGRPPELSRPAQARRAGRVLARAHQVLSDCPVADEPRYRWPWQWVTRSLDTIAMPAEVHAAVCGAWREIVQTVDEHRLAVSLIHGDPGPDGFLLSDTGQDALVDWATTLRGPLLYDLASFAVITRQAGPEPARWFTEGYAEQMPQITAQLDWLDCLIRARWVAQAIYFCSRIERGIERGPGPPTANQDGLAAAYAALATRP